MEVIEVNGQQLWHFHHFDEMILRGSKKGGRGHKQANVHAANIFQQGAI
jgi:hypothetical protein